jgi:hypothetical protein
MATLMKRDRMDFAAMRRNYRMCNNEQLRLARGMAANK